MNSNQIVLFLTVFIFFILLMNSMGFSEGIITEGKPGELTESPFDKEVCKLGGWTDIIGAVKCSIENVKYFTSLLFISSKYKMLNYIIFIPFSITMIYIIVKILRGGG